ncbi:nucleotidyltransferase domain-containing protein [Lachnospiraceae bacterium MD308]|mgnify:CR=1 FL=1|jgi:predicted nucleotidyltransferase|nr:nucleotidyltransferase domain-containing protein [Lachnospiraceae bacterium MD308]MCI8581256.1 nucleotidyltransferase domain-containing protein [Dorea sp.]
MSDKLSVILGNYKDAVIKIFEGKAAHLVLYGSYARGDFHIDSDVDIRLSALTSSQPCRQA